jgi:hypothetical protein
MLKTGIGAVYACDSAYDFVYDLMHKAVRNNFIFD